MGRQASTPAGSSYRPALQLTGPLAAPAPALLDPPAPLVPPLPALPLLPPAPPLAPGQLLVLVVELSAVLPLTALPLGRGWPALPKRPGRN